MEGNAVDDSEDVCDLLGFVVMSSMVATTWPTTSPPWRPPARRPGRLIGLPSNAVRTATAQVHQLDWCSGAGRTVGRDISTPTADRAKR